jgi:FtsZ-interacting cell division protein ZipA
MFFAPAPQYLDHIHKHAVGVFVFVVVVVWGAERKGREQVFPKNRERRRSSSKKKSKSRESEKKQKKNEQLSCVVFVSAPRSLPPC